MEDTPGQRTETRLRAQTDLRLCVEPSVLDSPGGRPGSRAISTPSPMSDLSDWNHCRRGPVCLRFGLWLITHGLLPRKRAIHTHPHPTCSCMKQEALGLWSLGKVVSCGPWGPHLARATGPHVCPFQSVCLSVSHIGRLRGAREMAGSEPSGCQHQTDLEKHT